MRAYAFARILRCGVWTLDAEGGAINRGALQFEIASSRSWEPATLHGSAVPVGSRRHLP
jgi:hypothetical protein